MNVLASESKLQRDLRNLLVGVKATGPAATAVMRPLRAILKRCILYSLCVERSSSSVMRVVGCWNRHTHQGL